MKPLYGIPNRCVTTHDLTAWIGKERVERRMTDAMQEERRIPQFGIGGLLSENLVNRSPGEIDGRRVKRAKKKIVLFRQ